MTELMLFGTEQMMNLNKFLKLMMKINLKNRLTDIKKNIVIFSRSTQSILMM